MEERSPYEIVLEDLYAKRDEIDKAIKAIERFANGGMVSIESSAASVGTGDQVYERMLNRLRPGEFHGLSYPAAAKKILQMVPQNPLKTEQILTAIARSGRKVEGKTPISTIYSSLARNPDFQKVAEGTWGLSEWYPPSTRLKKQKDDLVPESSTEETNHVTKITKDAGLMT